MVPFAAILAIATVAAPPAEARLDPCTSARARFPSRVEGVSDDTLRALSSYRQSWLAACDPAAGPVDLEPLLGEAESLCADVILSRVFDVLTRFQPKGKPWPVPGIRRRGPSEFVPDWRAFAVMASERGMVDDQGFWRAASIVVDADGDPVWLGVPPPGGGDPCVRLGEVSWADVASALAQMERSRTRRYAAHGKRLKERFLGTLRSLADPPVCGCVAGDATDGLEALATVEEREEGSTDAMRALAKAARKALRKVRKSKNVRWLRDSPGAPPTGCTAKAP